MGFGSRILALLKKLTSSPPLFVKRTVTTLPLFWINLTSTGGDWIALDFARADAAKLAKTIESDNFIIITKLETVENGK